MSLPPTVFAYCKRSNTGGGNGLGTRLHCQPAAVCSCLLGVLIELLIGMEPHRLYCVQPLL